MERNGIHIIDLYKTVAKVDEAADALKNLAKQGKKVLRRNQNRPNKSLPIKQLLLECLMSSNVGLAVCSPTSRQP